MGRAHHYHNSSLRAGDEALLVVNFWGGVGLLDGLGFGDGVYRSWAMGAFFGS